MLKLYGGQRSRASIVQWCLEELSIPFDFVLLDMAAGEHRQPPFLAINPFGKVPAIADGDFTLWESGAILMYLAEKYGPPLSLEERSHLNQWVLFANATLGPGILIEANRDREMPRLLSALESVLQDQPFLMGQTFSVADVAVGSLLSYIPVLLKLDLSAYAVVTDYMQRLADRPAFQRSIGARFAKA